MVSLPRHTAHFDLVAFNAEAIARFRTIENEGRAGCYLAGMTMTPDRMPLRAQVRDGRLVLDVPLDLPEGTEVDLVPVADDELDEEDRRRLHAAIDRGLADGRAGRTARA